MSNNSRVGVINSSSTRDLGRLVLSSRCHEFSIDHQVPDEKSHDDVDAVDSVMKNISDHSDVP